MFLMIIVSISNWKCQRYPFKAILFTANNKNTSFLQKFQVFVDETMFVVFVFV